MGGVLGWEGIGGVGCLVWGLVCWGWGWGIRVRGSMLMGRGGGGVVSLECGWEEGRGRGIRRRGGYDI